MNGLSSDNSPHNGPLPGINALKQQAKRLRAELEAGGNAISHSHSLELLAHQYGFKDWNTLYAKLGNRLPACPVWPGQRVRGEYLGRPFDGEVTGVQQMATPGRYRVTFEFDEPVDVVTFDSFSNFRKRVSCYIDKDGRTAEKTSNGRRQLELHF